jgi:hypothetical protein
VLSGGVVVDRKLHLDAGELVGVFVVDHEADDDAVDHRYLS